MKKIMTYKKCLRRFTPLAAAALVLLMANSCRRDLWVFQDNYHQVEVDVDWRNYDRDQTMYPHTPDPDGMTLWFFPKDGRKSFRYTTSDVRHYGFYLSQGEYDGLVIDYSPAEYGHQTFVGMDYAATAKVEALPSSYQPDSIPELFGAEAYGRELPKKQDNGYYQVAWEPEKIASDTIHMNILSGKYDRYIPYEERDSYQSSLVKQLYNMEPMLIPWNMRVRIYIKGIYYLMQASASIAGLADGYMLVDCKASETPCLLKLDEWEIHTTRDSNSVAGGLGYIAKTFKTWGPMGYSNIYDVRTKQQVEELSSRPKDELRINLKCLLRDRKTIKYFHFNVGDLIRVYKNEYALRIDLEEGFDGMPDLPYVPAFNGIQFDGVVTPWEDTHQGNVSF